MQWTLLHQGTNLVEKEHNPCQTEGLKTREEGRKSERAERKERNSEDMEQKTRSPPVICDLAEPFIYAFSDGVMLRVESGREG